MESNTILQYLFVSNMIDKRNRKGEAPLNSRLKCVGYSLVHSLYTLIEQS